MTKSARLGAAAVFLFLLYRPAYIILLRRQARVSDPVAWSRLSTNGRFRLPIPELTAQRYHDEAYYAARIHQIALHGIPCNPYWRHDRRAVNWMMDFIPFYLMAGAGVFCDGDLTGIWVLTAALMGALWFLFFHRIFHWWSKRENVALPLALFSVLFPDFYVWFLDVNFSPAVTVDRWSNVFFQSGSRLLPEALRLPFNWLSFYLVAQLLFWTCSLLRSENKLQGRFALLGLLYGATIYVHPFEFLFSMTTLALLWGDARRPTASSVRRANLNVAVAASLLLPALYCVLLLGVDAQTRRDSAEMVGSQHLRHFYWTSLLNLLVAAAAWRQMERESTLGKKDAWRLLALAQAAVFLLRNMQLLIGIELSPLHYITLGSFVGAVMLFLWLSERLAASRWWDFRRAAAVCAVLVALASLREKTAAENTYTMYGLPADMEEALAWADREIPKDGLVLTLSMETTKDVALFTKAKVLVPPAAGNISGLFSTEEYLTAVAKLLKTAHVDSERFLRERWVLPDERAAAFTTLAREQNQEHFVDVDLLEKAQSFHPLLQLNGTHEKVISGRRRILALVPRVPAAAGPYYLWVNQKDAQFFQQDPAEFGGRLVHSNKTVRIYLFDGP